MSETNDKVLVVEQVAQVCERAKKALNSPSETSIEDLDEILTHMGALREETVKHSMLVPSQILAQQTKEIEGLRETLYGSLMADVEPQQPEPAPPTPQPAPTQARDAAEERLVRLSQISSLRGLIHEVDLLAEEDLGERPELVPMIIDRLGGALNVALNLMIPEPNPSTPDQPAPKTVITDDAATIQLAEGTDPADFQEMATQLKDLFR